MCIMLVQHFLSSQCWLVLIYKKVNETRELVVYNLKPLEPLMIAKASYSSPQLLSSTAKSGRKRMSFNSKANKSLLLCVWDQIVQTEREICEEYKSKSQLFSLCRQVVFFIQFLTLPLFHSLTMFPCFSLKKNPMTHEPEGKFLQ